MRDSKFNNEKLWCSKLRSKIWFSLEKIEKKRSCIYSVKVANIQMSINVSYGSLYLRLVEIVFVILASTPKVVLFHEKYFFSHLKGGGNVI